VELSPELPQNSKVLVMSPAIFFLECLNLACPSCDFRFWEGQEEKKDRRLLAICKLLCARRKEHNQRQGGERICAEGVAAPFSEIGKDETDGYKSPRT
jgi:hypothetical protein